MHKYNEVRQIRRRLLGSIECFVLVYERGGVMTSHVEPVARLSLRSSVTSHQHEAVRDSRHLRSASRARRMRDGGIRVFVPALRLRTSCSHAPTEGFDAIRSSSQRRNSCMDWRWSAARSASSSRTSSGTPLMVICTAMNALSPH